MPGPSYDALKRFFETAEVAREATRPLHEGAEVGLELSGGKARFTMAGGKPVVADEPALAPDFTLRLPDAAVERITSLQSDDVGEFGVEFFKLILEHDPSLKAHVHLDASTGQLLKHGYLSVLAKGGMKVTWWLLKNGVKNPKAAIDRLRGGPKH
jgi:hypothetical protein